MRQHVSLVEDDKPRFCVQIVPPQDSEAIRDALGELVVHLEKCLGSPIEWFDRWREDNPPVRLVINL